MSRVNTREHCLHESLSLKSSATDWMCRGKLLRDLVTYLGYFRIGRTLPYQVRNIDFFLIKSTRLMCADLPRRKSAYVPVVALIHLK